MTAQEIKNDLTENITQLRTLTAAEIGFCYRVRPEVATTALQSMVKDGLLNATRINRVNVYTVRVN